METGDMAWLVSTEALRAENTLLRAVGGAVDLPGAYTLGWLHWLRYQALPPGKDQADLQLAVALFAEVRKLDPTLLPAPLRDRPAPDPADADTAGIAKAVALTQQGLDAMNAFEQGAGIAAIRAAVESFRGAVAAIPAAHPERSSSLNNLGTTLRTLFELAGNTDALAEATRVHRAAVAATTDTHPKRAEYLDNLGVVLRLWAQAAGDDAALAEAVAAHRDAYAGSGQRSYSSVWHLGVALHAQYERTNEIETLAEAIASLRAGVTAAPDDDPELANGLNDLGSCLSLLFKRTGDLDALTEGIAAFRSAVAAAATDQQRQIRIRYHLAHALNHLFDRTGDVTALREATAAYRSGVAATPDSDAEKLARMAILGAMLQTLATRTGDIEAVTEAINVARAALSADSDSQSKALLSDLLGSCLETRYERTRDLNALTEAIAAHRAAIAMASADQRQNLGFHGNLGRALYRLTRHTRQADVLAEAITALRAEAAGSAETNSRRAAHLTNLGLALLEQADQANDVAYVAEAVQVMRAAVAVTAGDEVGGAQQLGALGMALRDLYRHTGDPEQLAEAVSLGRAAIDRMPAGHDSDLAECMNRLSATLRIRFDRTGDPDSLAEAISLLRAALAVIPEDATAAAGYLHNLGLDLRAEFERTGDVAALREGIGIVRAAAAAMREDNMQYPVELTDLGALLQMHFSHTRDSESLAEAVAAHRAAVAATSADHPSLARHVMNLGNALHELADRLSDPELNAEAVAVHRRAVAVASDRALPLTNLGNALRRRYEMSGDLNALTEAVAIQRAAVDAAAEPHPDRVLCLHNLGSALRLLTDRAAPESLSEAISVLREAASGTPADHPDWAGSLINLSSVLLTHWLRADDEDALAQAQQLLAEVAGSATAPVRLRVNAGTALARVSERTGDQYTALTAIEAAVALLPMLAPQELNSRDREHQLGEMPEVAAQAAAAALAAGRPERAVELLEQARGLLLAESLGPRAELSRLGTAAPELADELTRLRQRLSALSIPGQDPAGFARLAQERRGAAAEWDELIARIRVQEGFREFLVAPSIGTLRRHASEGPVVFVTADFARGDALIVVDDETRPVRHVPLPDLTGRFVREQADRFYLARGTVAAGGTRLKELGEAQAEMRDVLHWLWDAMAEPVLTALGRTATPVPGAAWPRIWWCPVGLLNYLPLHAAGYHFDGTGRTVLDRVVSSFTPTLRSLGYARQRPRVGDRAGSDVLIIAVPDAPGATALPGVVAETKVLRDLLPGSEILTGPRSTREAVTAALPKHRCVHFACHGLSDWTDPSRGRLLLHDHLENPLTVAEVSGLDLEGAELAYLSACSTSDTSPRLADEALHITGAFQLAGYRRVIGTLWPVSDRVAMRVAAGVYGVLTADGTQQADPDHAAQALHHSVRELRAEFPGLIGSWTAYLHSGA